MNRVKHFKIYGEQGIDSIEVLEHEVNKFLKLAKDIKDQR